MKKLRQVFLILLSLALAFSLFACGGDATCTSHVDNDGDGICDNAGCNAELEDEASDCKHVDKNPKDAKCDKCGEDVECAACVDEDKDAECDVCGKDVPCAACADADGDGRCDVCGKNVESAGCTSHVDQNKDAKCDNCGEDVECAACIDADKNAKCDVCGKDVPCDECVDEDPKDAKCDVCGKEVPCDECADEDGDEICDICGGEVDDPNVIMLIADKASRFQFVLADNIDEETKKYVEQEILAIFRNTHKIQIKSVIEGSYNDKETAVEVLIGDVDTRGDEYEVDKHTLGKKGYVIKSVGSKIVINAGSEEQLTSTVKRFAKNILGIEEDEITDVVFPIAESITSVQNDYSVTSLSVEGADMRGYTIAADLSRKYYESVAITLQEDLYERTGYWLEIVDIDDATDSSIIIRHVPKVYSEESYKIYTEGTKLIIDCAFDNKLADATGRFFLQKITLGRGDVNLQGNVYNQDISYVTYEEFDAKGDGKTDDFLAIYRTHVFANECGQTVIATGRSYYIKSNYVAIEEDGPVAQRVIEVKTNVNWGSSEFIIDDREMTISSITSSSDPNTKMNTHLFKVVPDADLAVITINDSPTLKRILADGINRNTTSIELDVGWSGKVMIIPYNSSHKVYRRRGYGAWEGGDMHECIVLNEDGTVSEETPIMFDYRNLNKVEVYRLDESSAITLEGGIFTTRACAANMVYYKADGTAATYGTYISRNIMVQRSYTTVKNVTHLITDEAPLADQVDADGNIIYAAPCYNGFFNGQNASYVTFDGCTLQGRRCYPRPQGGTGGTYDLGGNTVNKIVFKDCVQRNFWVKIDKDTNAIIPTDENDPNAIPSMASVEYGGRSLKMHWGIGGTNYCKNMEYIGSTLSRFDAHAGLYNGKVIDSTVNYLAITGNGDFIVHDTRYFAEGEGYGSNSLFHLRSDYGSTWEGEIDLKNVDAYVYTNAQNYLFYHSYTNWYFGYQACFPSLKADNLNFFNIKTKAPLPEGYEIHLTGSQVGKTSKLHLAESSSLAIFAIEDKDKDGYVDEPLIDRDLDGIIDGVCDLNGDGLVGNINVLYSSALAETTDKTKGVTTSFFTNLNMIRPPEYIKILNNDGVDTDGDGIGDTGGYKYVVCNTGENGNISDGGYWDKVETYGGFYGDTKFYYTEEDYFLGPNHPYQSKTDTFEFR